MKDKTPNFDEENIVLPEKGDLLFTSGDDWWHNACLNYMLDDSEFYVDGYKMAADVLVAQIKKKHQDQDFLIFPIVFLYRQYLELRLKQLISSGNKLQDKKMDPPKGHDLNNLWNLCRPILANLEPNTPPQYLEAIDEIIDQFRTIDPTSQAFRYSILSNGKKAISSDVKYVNLRQFSEIIQKVSNYFESATMMISVYLQNKHEMELDYNVD